jgi:type IV secretion system protein VirB6
VALLGFGLLTGQPGLRLAQVSRTGLKIGAVVALTLNWSVFQTLVFNVAAEAPFEVGHIFAEAARAGGSDLADSDPLTRLEAIHQELIDSAASLSPQTPGAAGGSVSVTPASAAAGLPPPGVQALFVMATILILSTVGLIALAMVAQAILVALGPAFILFFLFDATRGLFVGWVRALVGAIIAPITSWGGLMVLLPTLEPWIARLAEERGSHDIKAETLSTLVTFVATFAGAQVVMAIGAIVITSAFNLGRPRLERDAEAPQLNQNQQLTMASQVSQSRAEQLAQSLRSERNQSLTQDSRRLEVASIGGGGGGVADPQGAGSRLGDTYRRPSIGARLTAASGDIPLGDRS